MDAPSWAAVMLWLTLAAALANGLFFETAVGRRALVDQWERTALAFGQHVDDARYAVLQEQSTYGFAYGAGEAVARVALVALAVAALVVAVSRKASGRRVPFRAALAVTTHAGAVLAAREVLAAPISYARETTSSATSLARWLPMLDDTSPIARAMGALDVFVLWWILVLAVGVGVLTGRPARRVAVAFVCGYLGLAVALALTMAALGRTA